VPLNLTHESLGRLIGGRRPTVSLALKELASGGTLTRRPAGSWLVQADAFARLRIDAPAWQPADVRRPSLPVDTDIAPEAGRPPDRGLSAEDRAELHARVEGLRTGHAVRISRTATALERSRANRCRRRAASARTATAPAPGGPGFADEAARAATGASSPHASGRAQGPGRGEIR
jgi:hypothetical protein